MKIELCLILFFNVCFCIGSCDRPEDRIYRGYGNKDDYGIQKDDREYIIRPCSVKDLDCIRRVFAYNSKCTPVHGPAPDPYILKSLDLPIPQANLTFTLQNADVKGFNGWKIKEFYVNKATDRLLLEVEFDKITVTSPGSKTTFYRKGKEPIEVVDRSSIVYYGISLTLTIPNILDLQLHKGNVFTYVADASPPYTLGPAVRSIKDPDYVKGVSDWLDKLGVSMQEVWVSQGPVFMAIFLQSTICDFGYQLTVTD